MVKETPKVQPRQCSTCTISHMTDEHIRACRLNPPTPFPIIVDGHCVAWVATQSPVHDDDWCSHYRIKQN